VGARSVLRPCFHSLWLAAIVFLLLAAAQSRAEDHRHDMPVMLAAGQPVQIQKKCFTIVIFIE
jgi:hypothetical protein